LRGTLSGLAQMQAPEGTVISYATQPGNTAADGTGADSPYTLALADEMSKPGLDVLRMFNRIGVIVKQATAGQQQPWLSSSPIDGDYFFAGPGPTLVPTGPVAETETAMVQQGPPKSISGGPTKDLVGRWRFADGAACSEIHLGVVNVRDERVYFEWRRASGAPNFAVEHIDRVDGDAIYTMVESDRNTSTPQTGHKMRYLVTHDSWTSTDLFTGKSYTHYRC
jgi:Caspase domain